MQRYDFQIYFGQYTQPNEHFVYEKSHSNAPTDLQIIVCEIVNDFFFYFSTKTFVLSTQKNLHNEMVLGSFEQPKKHMFKLWARK